MHQGRWMEPFGDLNTQLRMSARNKFEENFYKLIVNSAFGKTMESKLGRKKLEIIRNEKKLLQKTALSIMKSFQTIEGSCYCLFRCNEYFVGQTHDNWCKYFGSVEKLHVFFHYRQMKANMNLELLYSDTDSFIYAIKTKDVYADLQKLTNSFSFFLQLPKRSLLIQQCE